MTGSNGDNLEANRGWDSTFRYFEEVSTSAIVTRLKQFISDASVQQIRAWNDSLPHLQAEVREVIEVRTAAAAYTAILEYELPMEARRADAVFLLRSSVVVVELKGKLRPNDADIDQAYAYWRLS